MALGASLDQKLALQNTVAREAQVSGLTECSRLSRFRPMVMLMSPLAMVENLVVITVESLHLKLNL